MSVEKERGSMICCPTEEELAHKVCTSYTCPVESCRKKFSRPQTLRLHLVKTHRVIENEKDKAMYSRAAASTNLQWFHCPIKDCQYHFGKYFASYRNLRQHYINQHTEKKFICKKCGVARYAQQRRLSYHEKTCLGETYKSIQNVPLRPKNSSSVITVQLVNNSMQDSRKTVPGSENVQTARQLMPAISKSPNIILLAVCPPPIQQHQARQADQATDTDDLHHVVICREKSTQTSSIASPGNTTRSSSTMTDAMVLPSNTSSDINARKNSLSVYMEQATQLASSTSSAACRAYQSAAMDQDSMSMHTQTNMTDIIDFLSTTCTQTTDNNTLSDLDLLSSTDTSNAPQPTVDTHVQTQTAYLNTAGYSSIETQTFSSPSHMETQTLHTAPSHMQTQTMCGTPSHMQTQTMSGTPSHMQTQTMSGTLSNMETQTIVNSPTHMETQTFSALPSDMETQTFSTLPSNMETQTLDSMFDIQFD